MRVVVVLCSSPVKHHLLDTGERRDGTATASAATIRARVRMKVRVRLSVTDVATGWSASGVVRW